MNTPHLLIVSALLTTLLSGCGGGGAKVSNQTTATTVGQELLDLDRAYKSGLISEKEYNNTREKILARE